MTLLIVLQVGELEEWIDDMKAVFHNELNEAVSQLEAAKALAANGTAVEAQTVRLDKT